MRKVLIIGTGSTGCEILQKMADYHTKLSRVVSERIAIVQGLSTYVESIGRLATIEDTSRDMKVLTREVSLKAERLSPIEKKPKYIRQQHKLAQRHYMRK